MLLSVFGIYSGYSLSRPLCLSSSSSSFAHRLTCFICKIWTETFIYRTEGLILQQLDDIFGDYSELKPFLAVKNLDDLRWHPNSLRYVGKLDAMLSDVEKSRRFYLNYMAFSWLLFLEVNRGLLVTYTERSEAISNLDNQLKPYMPLLKEYVAKHNPEFFNKDSKMYYHPIVKDGNELKLNI